MTLEAQYKKYLKENSLSTLTFDLWKDYNSHNIKQALVNMMKADEELGLYDEPTKCYCSHTVTCDCGPEEPKQERMYSEEDMREAFYMGGKHIATEGKIYEQSPNFETWFEQFKKEVV